MSGFEMEGLTDQPSEIGASDSKTLLLACGNAEKKGRTGTLSEYILDRLSSRSDMDLAEFSMIMSFPRRFKYRTSVSTRINGMVFVEGNQGGVD